MGLNNLQMKWDIMSQVTLLQVGLKPFFFFFNQHLKKNLFIPFDLNPFFSP